MSDEIFRAILERDMLIVIFKRIEIVCGNVGLDVVHLRNVSAADENEFFTNERAIHAVKDCHKTATACVHNARLFEHREHIGSLLQDVFARIDDAFEKFFKRELFGADCRLRFFCHNSHNGENRAFFWFFDCSVGNFRALLQAVCKGLGGKLRLAFERNRETAENL